MKKQLKLIAGCIIVLVALLATTDPARLPSVVLIVPFGLLFMIITLAVATLLSWQQGSVSAKNMRKGAAWAAPPTLLLVLQSVGQLTLRDAATILILFVLAYFYVSKMKAPA